MERNMATTIGIRVFGGDGEDQGNFYDGLYKAYY